MFVKGLEMKEMFNFQNQISRDLAQASHGDSRNLFDVRPVALRVQFVRDQCFTTLRPDSASVVHG